MANKAKTVLSSRTLVVHPYTQEDAADDLRSPVGRLEEACSLAEAIDLEVVQRVLVHLRKITPASYLGAGKAEELGEFIKAEGVGLVVMDCHLSPIQQRNLEKAWEAKVIDRTALILEIFGARAQTGEGVLQVELAALEYQKSRLVRSWTHLERQRGGFGFLGGPGESQIESDRRQIRERIGKIKRELETVKKTRQLHRKSRGKVPYPVAALVGYTNAGKSTLFNRLTGAHVRAEDLLFATLDPTMRKVKLPSGREVIFSDTVGFISDLPTELIAAFRATLEEVLEADLILHVRDIASDDTKAQKQDVLQVLSDLGLTTKLDEALIEVLNKIDKVGGDVRERLQRKNTRHVDISALTGEGVGDLLTAVDKFFAAGHAKVELELPASDGKTLAWLYQHGENVRTEVDGEVIRVKAELSEKHRAQLEKGFGFQVSGSGRK